METTQLDEKLQIIEGEIANLRHDVAEFKKSIKDEIKDIVENWIEKISEFQKLLGDKINIKISNKVSNINSAIDFETLIRDSIQKTIHIERNEYNYINTNFIKEINAFIVEKKSELNLEKYFVKNNIIDLESFEKGMKENISPEFSVDYKTDFLIAGGSATVAGILALSVASPFALIGLFGIGYGEFVIKPQKLKEEIQRKLPIIQEQIEDIIQENITNIQNRGDDIVSSLLAQIHNDMIEAYKTKERIYQEVLENKSLNLSNEKSKYFQEMIIEINAL